MTDPLHIFRPLGLLCLLIALSASAQITVGIADFENRTDRVYLDEWSTKIPSFLQSELSGSPEIQLVERESLQALIDERALGQTGLIDSTGLENAGKILSAQYIITGTIDRMEGWVRIDAKVINTTTGKVFTEKVQCKSRKFLNEMVVLLGRNLNHQLTGSGSYTERLKVEKYPVRTSLLVTGGLGLASLILNSQYEKRRESYQQEIQLAKLNEKYDAANKSYKTRNILLSVTAVSALVSFLFWTNNLSAESVIASEPGIQPYLWVSNEGAYTLGVLYRF